MLLVDARLTEQLKENEKLAWIFESYGKNSTFLCNKSIGQYIKLPNGLKNREEYDKDYDSYALTTSTDVDNQDGGVTIYTNYVRPFKDDLKIVNNRYTLNMTLGNTDEPEILVNFSIDIKRFSVLRYLCSYDIKSTYRNFDDHQGCFITVPVSKLVEGHDTVIMYTLLYDSKDKRYKKFKLFLTKNPEVGFGYELKYRITDVLTHKEFALCKKVSNNFGNRTLGFKYDIKGRTNAPTQFVLYKESDEDKILSNDEYIGGNYTLLRIPDDKIEDVSYLTSDIHSRLNGTKIKAITEYNMTLPLQFFKVLKIIYVFEIIEDGDKTRIKCLRSN